jgi:hypothetical protein
VCPAASPPWGTERARRCARSRKCGPDQSRRQPVGGKCGQGRTGVKTFHRWLTKRSAQAGRTNMRGADLCPSPPCPPSRLAAPPTTTPPHPLHRAVPPLLLHVRLQRSLLPAAGRKGGVRPLRRVHLVVPQVVVPEQHRLAQPRAGAQHRLGALQHDGRQRRRAQQPADAPVLGRSSQADSLAASPTASPPCSIPTLPSAPPANPPCPQRARRSAPPGRCRSAQARRTPPPRSRSARLCGCQTRTPPPPCQPPSLRAALRRRALQ